MELVARLIRGHGLVVTIEEGAAGGFGAHVLSAAANGGLLDHGTTKLRALTLPDFYQSHDTQDRMYAEAGLDAAHIVERVTELAAKAKRSAA